MSGWRDEEKRGAGHDMGVQVAMVLLGETVQDVTAKDDRTQRENTTRRGVKKCKGGERYRGHCSNREKGSESVRAHSYLFAC